MGKTLVTAVFGFVFLANLGCANAQVLWGGTHFGMHPDEVKKVIPNLIVCADPDNRLANGAMGLLCKPKVTIAGEQFKVNFYFINKCLTQVTLSFQGKHSFSEARIIFDSIADVLRSKYGHELSLHSQSGIFNRITADWMSGRTNINLLSISSYSFPAILNINYQVRVSQDADKM